MSEAKEPKLALFELYVATAEKVSDRRAQANSWMLSVNSAVVTLYGYLQAGKEAVSAPQKAVWIWAIPLAGAIVSLAWAAILASYSRLNGAKFKVLHEVEKDLAYPLFRREQEFYKAEGRRRLSRVESWIPWTFVVLYVLMIAASFRGIQ
jgi:hypothetical protein